jgi:hypothetical protein
MAGGIKVHVYGDYDDKDVKKAIKDLQSLQGQAGPTEKATSGIAAGFKSIALAAGAFIGLSAVKNFMGDAIQQGSALEESLSKVNVVFGDSADAIIAWSEDSATAFGQSQAQALESVGTFGNLLQAFGSTQDEAQKMSQRMVELAADLASFNNTSVDDALTALRSGLSGETEPLKRFGVAINDARLKTVALEKGLYSGKGTLDTYAKSVAAYELILKDTNLAQGDFARTSDGFANQMRIIEASVDDAKAAIGVALIGVIGDLGDAMGGADGINGVIDGFSDKIVNNIEIIRGWISILGGLEGAFDIDPGFFGTAAFTTMPEIIGQITGRLRYITGYITGDLEAAAEGLYDAWGLKPVEASDRFERASGRTFLAAKRIEDGSRDAADAIDEATAAVNGFKDAINAATAWNNFRDTLANIRDDVDKTNLAIRGTGEAARDNRGTLLSAFGEAAGIAEAWGKRTGASVDEVKTKFDKLGSKIVDEFVAQGFKRSDVEAFLNERNIWVSPTVKIAGYMKAAGVTIGKDLINGMAGAINSPANLATLRYAGMQAAAAAEQGARIESETESPSKKWAKLGGDLVSGLIVGLGSKKDALKAEAGEVTQQVIDAADAKLAAWDDTIAAYKERYDELASYAKGISSSLFGQLDLGAAVDQARETGGSIVDAFAKQAEGIGTFAQNLILLTETNLSQTAWEAVAAMSADRGNELSEAMLGAQGQTIINGINDTYAAVEHMADAVGERAALKFYDQGVSDAQATYEGFKANFGEGGPARNALMNLMDRLSSAMNRSATITVTTVNRVINQTVNGTRAAGGPVAAGKSYLVGERGPEMLVMGSQPGFIVPNNELPMASGGVRGGDGASMSAPTYTINVQAGVGDPRQIGQQVVEYIKRFESSNGAVFAAA